MSGDQNRRVLLIGGSPLFREYLSETLNKHGLKVDFWPGGLAGFDSLLSPKPDLIIMDYDPSSEDCSRVLGFRKVNPDAAGVPLLLFTRPPGIELLSPEDSAGITGSLIKPVRPQTLLKKTSEILSLEIKQSPESGRMSAHFNEEILFIDISRGLGEEDIELLPYRIRELLNLYGREYPKTVVQFIDLCFQKKDAEKLKLLFDRISEATGIGYEEIRVLIPQRCGFEPFKSSPDLSRLGIYPDLEAVLNSFAGNQGQGAPPGGGLKKGNPGLVGQDREEIKLTELFPKARIAVVDDDIIIQELMKIIFGETKGAVSSFSNGREFVEALNRRTFDLVFLDLMMPVMNGYEVLKNLEETGRNLPVVVFSAFSSRETIIQAVNKGIKNYLTKPFKPEKIITKTAEILYADF